MLFLLGFLVGGTLVSGARRTVILLAVGTLAGFVSEWISIRIGFPYGAYTFHLDAVQGELVLGGVPLWSSISFATLAWAAHEVVRWLGWRSQVLAPALMMTLADVLLDPITVLGERWFLGPIYSYQVDGWWFGVPLSNFVGWFVVGCGIHLTRHVLWNQVGAVEPRRWCWTGPTLYYAILVFISVVGVAIGEPLRVLVGWIPQFVVFGIVATGTIRRRQTASPDRP